MFRDDLQLARASRRLLGTVRLDRLWNEAGPTFQATELLESDSGYLSSGSESRSSLPGHSGTGRAD